MRSRKLLLILIPAMAVLCLPAYVFSILWRVSVAEQSLFGRSDLIPLSMHPQTFHELPTPDSFGKETYTYAVRGRSTRVYEQLINSFQHVYGSALASYELGEKSADLLFRANEYFEAICWKNSGSMSFYLDTRKDLANNSIGRKIGTEARQLHVNGVKAENFMISKIFSSIDDGTIYRNCSEPRVAELPTLKQYGCPLLPKIQSFRRLDKTLKFE